MLRASSRSVLQGLCGSGADSTVLRGGVFTLANAVRGVQSKPLSTKMSEVGNKRSRVEDSLFGKGLEAKTVSSGN